MRKYNVCVPYVAWKYYEVEADNEEEAINKAFEENDIEESIGLCWHCANEAGELLLDDNMVLAEEVE